MKEDVCLALCTFPDAETARKISRTLIEEALTACANIVSGVDSIYFWRGKVEESSEVLTIFKLAKDKYEQFENRLRMLHPYDVPEIIQLPIAGGSADYLRWVGESCAHH